MATETNPIAYDKAPTVQRGVCSEYPLGYAGDAVHWIGKVSQLKDETCYIKLPKGFKPARYAVTAQPTAGDGRYGNGPFGYTEASSGQTPVAAPETGFVSGDTVTITVAPVVLSGTTFTSGSGFTAFSGTLHAATEAVMSGTTVTTPATEATYGLAMQGDVASGALVEDDVTYASVVAAGTLSGDAVVEVDLFLAQIDPHPEKMF